MISRRKKASVAILLLLILIGVVVLPRLSRERVNAAVIFVGWTNVAGRLCASLVVHPVMERKPLKNFFFFQFYRARFDYVYTTDDGIKQAACFNENIGFSPHLPTLVEVPIPTNAASLQFTGVQSWMERRWDNVRPPFSLPSRMFILNPPLISENEIEELRRRQARKSVRAG